MRVIALATMLLAACGGAEQADAPTASATAPEDVRPAPPISGREARQLVAAGAVLLDVRTAAEFSLRHIDGAINIPLAELEGRTQELDPEMPTIVYCMSGHRSEKAGRALRASGFTYVFDLGAMTSY